MNIPTPRKALAELREIIRKQTEEFIAKGGQVDELDIIRGEDRDLTWRNYADKADRGLLD